MNKYLFFNTQSILKYHIRSYFVLAAHMESLHLDMGVVHDEQVGEIDLHLHEFILEVHLNVLSVLYYVD